MAGPLNETELTALLMESPLYKKLEQIRKTISEGGVKSGHKPAPGECVHFGICIGLPQMLKLVL